MPLMRDTRIVLQYLIAVRSAGFSARFESAKAERQAVRFS